MKKFYSWYKKHITAAIFTGLILGIITGLFLENRFEPVLAITSLIGSIYMNADRKSTRLNSSHIEESRMPSSA